MTATLCDTVRLFNCRGHHVQIDLNNPEALTLAAVRQLIASASDTAAPLTR